LRKTSDTVARETPACSAMSFSVIRDWAAGVGALGGILKISI
jgi:hypothetical protein